MQFSATQKFEGTPVITSGPGTISVQADKQTLVWAVSGNNKTTTVSFHYSDTSEGNLCTNSKLSTLTMTIPN